MLKSKEFSVKCEKSEIALREKLFFQGKQLIFKKFDFDKKKRKNECESDKEKFRVDLAIWFLMKSIRPPASVGVMSLGNRKFLIPKTYS